MGSDQTGPYHAVSGRPTIRPFDPPIEQSTAQLQAEAASLMDLFFGPVAVTATEFHAPKASDLPLNRARTMLHHYEQGATLCLPVLTLPGDVFSPPFEQVLQAAVMYALRHVMDSYDLSPRGAVFKAGEVAHQALHAFDPSHTVLFVHQRYRRVEKRVRQIFEGQTWDKSGRLVLVNKHGHAELTEGTIERENQTKPSGT